MANLLKYYVINKTTAIIHKALPDIETNFSIVINPFVHSFNFAGIKPNLCTIFHDKFQQSTRQVCAGKTRDRNTSFDAPDEIRTLHNSPVYRKLQQELEALKN